MSLTREELNKKLATIEKLASSLHTIRNNLSIESTNLSDIRTANVDFGSVSNKVNYNTLDPITRFAMQ